MNGPFKKAINDLAHYVLCAKGAADRAWQAAPNGDCRDVLTDVIQRLVSIADDGRAEASSGLVCEAWEAAKSDEDDGRTDTERQRDHEDDGKDDIEVSR